MRAVGVVVHGGPEALQVVDVPEVHAGPDQVRIRVHAAAVNPTDLYVRNGARAEAKARRKIYRPCHRDRRRRQRRRGPFPSGARRDI